MDLFFYKRKLKNEGNKWVITTINDLILSLYKIKRRRMKNDVKCTRRKKNECVYSHSFLALKTSMSISSDSENIFDII
jgi:hypothetical protein